MAKKKKKTEPTHGRTTDNKMQISHQGRTVGRNPPHLHQARGKKKIIKSTKNQQNRTQMASFFFHRKP